jgi:hypothetical protein
MDDNHLAFMMNAVGFSSVDIHLKLDKILETF